MIVLLSVQDTGTSDAVQRCAALLGHKTHRTAVPHLIEVAAGSDVVLVYDLSPWNTTAVEHLKSVRASSPTLPILLCLPHLFDWDVGHLLLQCADVGGLTLVFQDPRGAWSSLSIALKESLESSPKLVLDRLVRLLLAGQQFACGCEYATTVVETLANRSSTWRSPGVAIIANHMGTHPRQLERAFRAAGLPNPRTLLGHVLLLWVLGVAAFAHVSFVKGVALSGLDSKRMRRIRRRLLAQVADNTHANQLFSIAFLEFARACGVPVQRASEVLSAQTLKAG